MKKINIIIALLMLTFCIGGLTSQELMAATTQTSTAQKTTTATAATSTAITPVKPLALVNNPNAYLNKKVKITATFDKFSSLGLDYKPALRSSEKYITFLIRRDDAQNDIPLSELKNFMKREMAEKFIDLETDDVIEYTGFVFSNALGDVWLDVESFKIVSSKSKQKTK